MKSNLNATHKCAAHPLAHRKERKTWEKPLKCSTTSLLLPRLKASKKQQHSNFNAAAKKLKKSGKKLMLKVAGFLLGFS